MLVTLLTGGGAWPAYRSDARTDRLGTLNLLGVCRRRDQSIGQSRHSQLANSRTNSKGLNSIGPEELVPEERLDYSWNTRCTGRSTLNSGQYVAKWTYL